MASTEFTKKFKAAIRTKIEELGIEVDDELTDYIMIMIANKKDKPKMKNDLMLFLSDHTDVFVDWLFDFFDKVNKKESEDSKPKDADKSTKRKHSEEKVKSRSRSPVHRSRSKSRSPKRSRREEEKPRRQPIRAPSPGRDGKNSRRRRSRSIEDDRRRHRGDRKKVTYSESDEDDTKVRSAVVPKKTDRNHSPPRVSSQVVVKKRKSDPMEEKAASNLFKRALNESLREDEAPKRKSRRVEDDGVLQVNTSKSTRRTILVDGDVSDRSEEEEQEPQFIVKVKKGSKLAKGEGATNENAIKRKRRQDNPVRAFLELSGIKAKGGAELDEATRKKILAAAASQAGEFWDGKISIEDEDLSESDDEEAEIDAFLADNLVPPTASLSRPILPAPQKKQFVAKSTEVGKIPERCRFYPNCRNEAACMYSHPSKPCINFPNCWFGDKCLFIHPKCKFEPNCSKPGCPYMHTMPRNVVQKPLAPRQPNPLPITTPEKESTTSVKESTETEEKEKIEKENNESAAEGAKEDETEENGTEKNDEEKKETNEEEKKETNEEDQTSSDAAPDVAVATSGPVNAATAAPKIKPMTTVVSSVPCRFGARCHTEACTFRHPKKCRYDETCTNEGCYFWHPKKNATRFRWTKTA